MLVWVSSLALRENVTKKNPKTTSFHSLFAFYCNETLNHKHNDFSLNQMEGRGRSVEDIFEDFKSRRAGIIKALTVGTNFWIFLQFLLLFFSILAWDFSIHCLIYYSSFMLCCQFWISCIGFWNLFIFVLMFVLAVLADVEDFYRQCDPG